MWPGYNANPYDTSGTGGSNMSSNNMYGSQQSGQSGQQSGAGSSQQSNMYGFDPMAMQMQASMMAAYGAAAGTSGTTAGSGSTGYDPSSFGFG